MATGGLEIGRINVAARSVGIARRALKESIAYAQTRQTMGKPICEHQAIQLKLGEMGAKTRAAELLVEDAARAYDTALGSIWKPVWQNTLRRRRRSRWPRKQCVSMAGTAIPRNHVIERLYRDAPLMCIGEGTNEMQRIIISKQLVKRNPI